MISILNYAAPVNVRGNMGFKAVEVPDKKKYPKIHEAWELANKKEVKDAIAITVKKNVEFEEFDRISRYLNRFCRNSDINEKTAIKMAMDAQNEWQINEEDNSRKILYRSMDATYRGKSI